MKKLVICLSILVFVSFFSNFALSVTTASLQKPNIVLIQPFSDFPIFNNQWVQNWIKLFQNSYSDRFRIWLKRSYSYVALMQAIFEEEGLPRDLVYIAMIESGFSAHAVSSAKAVGYWQFLSPTAERFGLKKTSWLDERKDFEKSTIAAAQYLKFLYKKFGTWHLAVAAYNMGEQRLSSFIKKYKTNNFWHLAQKMDFPTETAQYIPQLIAAITIAKTPSLYGFNYLKTKLAYEYEIFYLPGGTNLRTLAQYIKYPYRQIKNLNPSLLIDVLPHSLEDWGIRIPKGTSQQVSNFIQKRKI